MEIRTGVPPCEGQGPTLVAAHITTSIKSCPLIVLIEGKKVHVIAYGEGSLVVTIESFMPTAFALIGQIAEAINADMTASADLSWSASKQTSTSFRQWADDVCAWWKSANG